mgnify:CR=1 FL=1
MTDALTFLRPLLLALALAGAAPPLLAQGTKALRTGDFIVAVVNQELVTASELEARIGRVHQ